MYCDFGLRRLPAPCMPMPSWLQLRIASEAAATAGSEAGSSATSMAPPHVYSGTYCVSQHISSHQSHCSIQKTPSVSSAQGQLPRQLFLTCIQVAFARHCLPKHAALHYMCTSLNRRPCSRPTLSTPTSAQQYLLLVLASTLVISTAATTQSSPCVTQTSPCNTCRHPCSYPCSMQQNGSSSCAPRTPCRPCLVRGPSFCGSCALLGLWAFVTCMAQ